MIGGCMRVIKTEMDRSAGKAVKAEVEKNRLLREDLSKAKNNMMYMRIQYAVSEKKVSSWSFAKWVYQA